MTQREEVGLKTLLEVTETAQPQAAVKGALNSEEELKGVEIPVIIFKEEKSSGPSEDQKMAENQTLHILLTYNHSIHCSIPAT